MYWQQHVYGISRIRWRTHLEFQGSGAKTKSTPITPYIVLFNPNIPVALLLPYILARALWPLILFTVGQTLAHCCTIFLKYPYQRDHLVGQSTRQTLARRSERQLLEDALLLEHLLLTDQGQSLKKRKFSLKIFNFKNTYQVNIIKFSAQVSVIFPVNRQVFRKMLIG